jgi:ABC-type oligopeptide transport system substrate-binding subunit/DNA-binding SARP family transcriptional activator
MLRVSFLGALDMRYGGEPLPKPPTVKSQSLLAYLIYHRHQSDSRDRLAELFWGDKPQARARHSLATALWQIRRCLPREQPILSDLASVHFNPQVDLWLDVDQFTREITHPQVDRLKAALALYRGDFLVGFYDDWIINERYRLETLYHSALARLMSGQEATGEVEAALSTALRLLEHDPLREDAHRLAMRAYCRLGHRNAALEQYRRCRAIVHADLGAEPTPETNDLHRSILQGHYPVARSRGLALTPQAMGLPTRSGRSPLDAIEPSRLVGREQELGFLQERWQGDLARQARVVLLSGEAGVGKTRLAQEFASRLGWQGAFALWGRCYEFERDLPYQPVSEALRAAVSTLTAADLVHCPPRTVTQVARLAPEILERLPGLPPATPGDPSQEQARLFDGVADFLLYLSTREPLLMVVEDLHWGGESALQMLHYVARHLAGYPILVLATFREEAVGRRHPLRRFQGLLHREGLAHLLRLSRLPPEAVQALVLQMSGAGDSVVPLAERLFQETEGNPFFLMEIVKALFEAGLIQMAGGTWQGDWTYLSQEPLPIPVSLSETIQARVDALDDDAQEALRLAAVLGRAFDFDVLCRAWGRGEGHALEALDTLLRRRLLDEASGAVGRDYTFTHHKIQEVVYARIPRRHRQRAHTRAGAAMEQLYNSVERQVSAGELAHHFEQGDETEKAIGYLLQAGDEARKLYAHREAVDHYRRALALLRGQGDHERAARTLMRLGLTYHSAFDFQRAREAYADGFALWQRASSIGPLAPLPPAPHALRTHWADPQTLDPGLADSLPSTDLIEQLFTGLVALSPEMEILPSVARRWELSEGGRRYLFHLRGDVLWSDGTPLTAHDFEYAWKRVLDPRTGSRLAYLLYDVKGARPFHQGKGPGRDGVGVQALDGATLAVELESPTGYFLHLLAHTVTWPVPRHVVERLGKAWTEGLNIVTSGPFRVQSWQPGERLVLTRHPAYHGRFEGNVQRVELTLLPNQELPIALEMYQADELDILDFTRLSPTGLYRVRQDHPGEYLRVPTLQTTYIGFDVERPPFDDDGVRRAFVLATDREALADEALKGNCLPAMGGFVPPGMPGHSPGIALPYDPDCARRLLAEAGFPGGQGFPPVEALALLIFLPHVRYLQSQWKGILGVEILWQLGDLQSLFDRVHGPAPPQLLAMGHMADYPDPDSFLRATTPLGPLCIGRGNQGCEGLAEAARQVADQPERMRLYRQAEKILIEGAGIMPLTHEPYHYLLKPWVTKYPTGAMNLRFWKDVDIEPH